MEGANILQAYCHVKRFSDIVLTDTDHAFDYGRISAFELEMAEPPLPVLRYARAAGVHMEDIANDELNCRRSFPATLGIKA